MSITYSIFEDDFGVERVAVSVATRSMVTTATTSRNAEGLPQFLQNAICGDIFNENGELIESADEDDDIEEEDA